MNLFKRKDLVINVDVHKPASPTIFEHHLGQSNDRKIISAHVDGMGMRLSAIQSENVASSYLGVWQLDDAEGNKMSGVLKDLFEAVDYIKKEMV